MHPTVIVDDGGGVLSPLADLRPSFDLRTGVLTTLERARARLDVRGAVVPEAMADLARERHAGWPINQGLLEPGPGAGQSALVDAPAVLLLNGRAPLAWRLAGSLKLGQVVVDAATGDLVAAVVPGSRVRSLVEQGVGGALAGLTSIAPDAPAVASTSVMLLSRPWHVRTLRDACVTEDLAMLVPRVVERFGWARLTPGVLRMGTHDVAAHQDSEVCPGVVLDTTGGPILIDEGAVVRPNAVLIGPCAVGAHATVLERATIRPFTVIGPWCKVNGEVGGTIFQGHANKAHDGYLGDSHVGEWVNLGAGTTNSNLLNTYGEVIARATPGGRSERTGEQFLGAIIGDHVKAAICTRLMTGCVVGTGSMLATSAATSGCVAAFSWCTDEGTRPYRLDKFVEVMRAAMARRKAEPGAAYLERLARVHAAAAAAARP